MEVKPQRNQCQIPVKASSRGSGPFPLGSWNTLLLSWLIILPSLQTCTEISNPTTAARGSQLELCFLPLKSLPDAEIGHYPPNSSWAGKKIFLETSPDTGEPGRCLESLQLSWRSLGFSAREFCCCYPGRERAKDRDCPAAWASNPPGKGKSFSNP